MKDYKGKIVGILGTVILHLIAAIIFMSFRIHSLNRKMKEEFIVEFEAVQSSDEEEKLIELPASSLERILQGDEELLNIARNLANRPRADRSCIILICKEELTESGKLGPR